MLFVCISRASVKPRFSKENKLLDGDEDDAEDNNNVDDDVNNNNNNNTKNNNMDKSFDFVFFARRTLRTLLSGHTTERKEIKNASSHQKSNP